MTSKERQAFEDRVGEFGLSPQSGKATDYGETYWFNGAPEWQLEMFKWAVTRLGDSLLLAASPAVGWWSRENWKYGLEGSKEASDFCKGPLLMLRFEKSPKALEPRSR